MEKIDKLERIFEMQEYFQKDLIARRKLQDIPTDKWIQMQTLAMLSELAELIDEVNFKWWKNPKPVEEDKVKEELVDILHFFVSMCLTSGMSAQELFDRYIAKNQENFDRQNGLSKKKGYESPAAEE